ncbi:MAG: acetate--CoA ligase family protein, partial [Desulfovibrionaceae bacterium]
EAGIPCYAFPEPAVQSLAAMYDHFLSRQAPREPAPLMERDLDAARAVLAAAEARGRVEVVEFEAQRVLAAYGLPTPKTVLARSTDEAVLAAESIGYPVVLKIASPDISHKSDVGGVKVGLRDGDAVARAFWDVTSRAGKMRPEAFVVGCLVQEMAAPGAKEVIIGFKRDEQFGPLVMFGLGGVYVEVLKDIAFRLAPMNRRDAFAIVRDIKSYMLLKGVRGEQPVNFEALEDIVLSMSQLAMDLPQVVEAEFNPVLVGPERALVADVRMTLRFTAD